MAQVNRLSGDGAQADLLCASSLPIGRQVPVHPTGHSSKNIMGNYGNIVDKKRVEKRRKKKARTESSKATTDEAIYEGI